MRAHVWVEVLPERSQWNPEHVDGVKVGRLMKRRPRDLKPDALLVKVNLDVPATAFGRNITIQL